MKNRPVIEKDHVSDSDDRGFLIYYSIIKIRQSLFRGLAGLSFACAGKTSG